MGLASDGHWGAGWRACGRSRVTGLVEPRAKCAARASGRVQAQERPPALALLARPPLRRPDPHPLQPSPASRSTGPLAPTPPRDPPSPVPLPPSQPSPSLRPLPTGPAHAAMAGSPFSQASPAAPAAPSPLNPGWSPASNQQASSSSQQPGVQRSTSAGSYSTDESSEPRRSGGAAGEYAGAGGGAPLLEGLARGDIGSAYGRSPFLSLCLFRLAASVLPSLTAGRSPAQVPTRTSTPACPTRTLASRC